MESLILIGIESQNVLELDFLHIGLSLLLMLGFLAIVLWQSYGMFKEGLIATARTMIQLVAAGYILNWVFTIKVWYLVMAVLTLMTIVAGHAASGRVEKRLKNSMWLLSGVIGIASGVTLLYVTQVVVQVHRISNDYFNPQYLIPLGGMILGNTMTAVALATDRYLASMQDNRAQVEMLLVLGASPNRACKRQLVQAFQSAMLPTINSMMTVGIVQLPGMMTGQILGGSPPQQAAFYQIVVMFMICFSCALGAYLVLSVLQRRSFTDAWQLKLNINS